MLVVWLFQLLTGVLALAFCALTAAAVLRRDPRAPLALTVSGALGLIFFVSVPNIRYELIAVALLAVIAGTVIGTPAAKPQPRNDNISFDSTATRRRR
jgi:hypothetical protein